MSFELFKKLNHFSLYCILLFTKQVNVKDWFWKYFMLHPLDASGYKESQFYLISLCFLIWIFILSISYCYSYFCHLTRDSIIQLLISNFWRAAIWCCSKGIPIRNILCHIRLHINHCGISHVKYWNHLTKT